MRKYYPRIAIVLLFGIFISQFSFWQKESAAANVAALAFGPAGCTYEILTSGIVRIRDRIAGTEFIPMPDKVEGFPVVLMGSGVSWKEMHYEGDLVLPSRLENVSSEAFAGAVFEGSLMLSSSLLILGDRSFTGSSFKEEQLILPDGITGIGEDAFSNCHWIQGCLHLPEGLTQIGGGAFQGCTGITDVFVPDGLLNIPDTAFAGIPGLTIHGYRGSEAERYAEKTGLIFEEIEGDYQSSCPLPMPTPGQTGNEQRVCGYFVYELADDGARIIKYNGTRGSLIIPAMLDGHVVVEIAQGTLDGYDFFWGDLVLPEGLKRIGRGVFLGKTFDGKLTLPSSVTDIGPYAFCHSKFKSGDLIIPEGVQTIEHYAFRFCTGIGKKLILPESVRCIKEYAFYGCSGIRSISIPSAVTEIDDSAFGSMGVNLVIYGDSGSVAEVYAKGQGYTFIAGTIPMPSPSLSPSPVPSPPPPTQTPVFPTRSPVPTYRPASTQSPRPTASPTVTLAPTESPVSVPTDVPSELPLQIWSPPATLLPAPSDNPVVRPTPPVKTSDKEKKMKAPVFLLKIKQTASGIRYVSIRLKQYQGTYVEFWAGKRVKGSKKLVYNKLKIKQNNIRKAKGVFNFQYTKQKGILVFRIRTYKKRENKRIYSYKSKGKRIRLT